MMKSLQLSLLLGAAALTAASPEQQVLQAPDAHRDSAPSSSSDSSSKLASWTKHLPALRPALGQLTEEAAQIFDEVMGMFPESAKLLASQSHPKPHQRKHDGYWDHIVRGEELASRVSINEAGEQQRQIDGKLHTYDMRIKKVDPAALGIDKVKQYSGYLDDKENDKHLFYWFFESRNDPKNDPVVLWLNGGPGCSSLTGLLMELGSSKITRDIKAEFNPYSWNANASVIYLDQPVNVGYSYSSGSVSTTTAASKDVYALMTLFFDQFPQYAKQAFHIAGESYAGHYIPVFAHEILSHKKRNINLQSVLIGNGLTDGYKQYEYYRPMACGDGGWPAVLDESECQSMDNALPRCQNLIKICYDTESVWTCVPAAIYCNNALIGPYQRTGMNPYDVREPCKVGNLCYEELDWVSEYLNKPEVMDALGAEVSDYESCNTGINRDFLFQGDWMKPFHRLVPDLLKEIPVLVYAGDADYICNWLGNQAWMEALEWPGQKAYNKASTKNLTLPSSGDTYGSVKSAQNFTFVRIHAAGHMVPYDQPEAGLDFLNRWLSGKWLA